MFIVSGGDGRRPAPSSNIQASEGGDVELSPAVLVDTGFERESKGQRLALNR